MTYYPKFFSNKGRILCGSCIQHKNSLEFKLLAFWRKYTPFIDQKCTYEKVTKILRRALPPPHLDKIQKNRYFLKPSLID